MRDLGDVRNVWLVTRIEQKKIFYRSGDERGVRKKYLLFGYTLLSAQQVC